jgi:4-amino-4-deoxy-L-arabinose transferase
MLETGNWWIPQLEYHPHLTKPPLTYWAIAAGMAVLAKMNGVRLYLGDVYFHGLGGLGMSFGLGLFGSRRPLTPVRPSLHGGLTTSRPLFEP